MARCVYCKRDCDRFSREHIIPESFGVFGSDTWTLTKEVCQVCNETMGRELDMYLARDSFEGLLRADKLGKRAPKTDRPFVVRRIEMRLPDEPGFGAFRGCKLMFDWHAGGPHLIDQALLDDPKTGEKKALTMADIEAADDGAFKDLTPGQLQILCRSREAAERFREALVKKSARFKDDFQELDVPPALVGPTILVEAQGIIDTTVMRAIAKIAFNYLVKVWGRDYVLAARFDRIRDFIRGVNTGQLVRIRKKPILADETDRWRYFDGHLIVVERRGDALIGMVSLFNSFTYEVMLCPDLGLTYPIRSGHAFDPFHLAVYPLHGVSRRFTAAISSRHARGAFR